MKHNNKDSNKTSIENLHRYENENTGIQNTKHCKAIEDQTAKKILKI